MKNADPKRGPSTARESFDPMKVWNSVKDNRQLLDNCKGPHDFKSEKDRPLLPNFRCTKCGGQVDWHAVHWYKRGLAHARNR